MRLKEESVHVSEFNFVVVKQDQFSDATSEKKPTYHVEVKRDLDMVQWGKFKKLPWQKSLAMKAEFIRVYCS